MLKAAIIYIPGSSGNLITRTLSMSETTIPCVSEEHSAEQEGVIMSQCNRMSLYSNWDSSNWTKTEKDVGMWFKFGKNDFYKYADSDRSLICGFHPLEFENETNKTVLWNSVTDWENIILIHWGDSSLDNIRKLAKFKRPDLDHEFQLPHEISCFNRIKFNVIHTKIYWEDFLNLESFLSMVSKLCRILNINDLKTENVTALYTTWKSETNKILIYD